MDHVTWSTDTKMNTTGSGRYQHPGYNSNLASNIREFT